MTIIYVLFAIFIIIFLLSLLITLHVLIKRIQLLETVVIEIYDSLVKSYKFSLINSKHINALWNTVSKDEINKNKPTVN